MDGVAGRPARRPQPAPDPGVLIINGIPRERAIFAGRVGGLRVARQWTRQQLASRSDIHRSIITGIEAGHKDPQLSTLLKLVDVFELCSLDQLFGSMPSESL